MPKKKQTNISHEFAEYLYLSTISDEFKDELVKILPNLTNKQIGDIYNALKSEKAKRELLELQFNLEMQKADTPKKLKPSKRRKKLK